MKRIYSRNCGWLVALDFYKPEKKYSLYGIIMSGFVGFFLGVAFIVFLNSLIGG